MIDISKPVTVIINGKRVFGKEIIYDNEFMIHSFRENFDRRAVWVNYINFTF